MHSLRWRIATSYALLLVGVVALLGIVVGVSFRSILYDQAKARIDRTQDDIARVAVVPDPFFVLGDSSVSSQSLGSPGNLRHWEGPSTFIQIDNSNGYLEGKSNNLGAARFPPNRHLSSKHDREFKTVSMPMGMMLVENRLIALSGRDVAIVHVGEPLASLYVTFARTRNALLVIFLIAIVCVVALSVLLAARAIAPIKELARAMRELGSDRLDRRLRWKHRHDELGALAETLDDLIARLQEAFARERQFISDASHELKTPLTVINANAQMLRRWGDADQRIRAESLDAIARESGSLASLLNGMLTLAKAGSGETIAKKPVAIDPTVMEVVEQAQARAAEKHLRLVMHASGDGAFVLGDAHLLHQAVQNLLDNAMKFTDLGEIEVTVQSSASEVCIEVRDTGPGIDEREVPLLFERFYRTDKSRDRAIPGTGLGLAIVRSIARVHDGTIAVESPKGGGALFRIRLPRLVTFCAALMAAVLATYSSMNAAAYADEATVDVGEAPVINVVCDGNLTVQTWLPHSIQARSSGPLSVQHLGVQRPAPGTQREMRVLSGSIAGPNGPLTLPEETFVVATSTAGHDAVTIKASGNTIITIPASTTLFVSRMPHGILRMNNYLGGTFVVRVRTGAVLLNNMGGDGFVQVLRGRIVARNSSFNRLRERTAIGDIIFQRCNARQIQVTSVDGNIVYGNGTFEPGLAQFESMNGNVTLGIAAGGAQINARSASGRIFTQLQKSAFVSNRSYEATAIIRGGGTLVSATTSKGAIFLYEGGFRGGHPPPQLRLRPGKASRVLKKPPKAKISAGRPHPA